MRVRERAKPERQGTLKAFAADATVREFRERSRDPGLALSRPHNAARRIPAAREVYAGPRGEACRPCASIPSTAKHRRPFSDDEGCAAHLQRRDVTFLAMRSNRINGPSAVRRKHFCGRDENPAGRAARATGRRLGSESSAARGFQFVGDRAEVVCALFLRLSGTKTFPSLCKVRRGRDKSKRFRRDHVQAPGRMLSSRDRCETHEIISPAGRLSQPMSYTRPASSGGDRSSPLAGRVWLTMCGFTPAGGPAGRKIKRQRGLSGMSADDSRADGHLPRENGEFEEDRKKQDRKPFGLGA